MSRSTVIRSDMRLAPCLTPTALCLLSASLLLLSALIEGARHRRVWKWEDACKRREKMHVRSREDACKRREKEEACKRRERVWRWENARKRRERGG